MSQATLKKRYGFENPFKPDPLSKKALKFLKSGGRLLDAGCGEGADSAYFARKGFRVTAIDRNAEQLHRFRVYRKDHRLTNIAVLERDVVEYGFPSAKYDVILSLLVLCCMKRSDFEKMLPRMKRSVKPGGVIVMSARNYLDPEYKEYLASGKMIEKNTFRDKEDCCKFLYFIEKSRLRALFHDFEILYYYEGMSACKYEEHPKHGDSYIICRRRE
jgi:2-polyprenyl-3-methyl-5-hydroxy-6-metoxy-1,4-benzoquinol methylase